MTGIFQGLKQAIRNSNIFKVLSCGAAGAPTVPGRVIVDETAQGMRLLHTADTITEAGWLQQALGEAGFYMEYVPSTAAGSSVSQATIPSMCGRKSMTRRKIS